MIYEQSDNVTIMIGVDINEVIIELSQTIRGSHFVFNGVENYTVSFKNIV